MSTDQAGKNEGNDHPARTWTCPMCGEEMACVLRAKHLTGHD